MATSLGSCYQECHWHYLTRPGEFHSSQRVSWQNHLCPTHVPQHLEGEEWCADNATALVPSLSFRAVEPSAHSPQRWRRAQELSPPPGDGCSLVPTAQRDQANARQTPCVGSLPS